MEEHNINVKLGDYILDIAAGPFGSNLKVDCFIQRGFPIIDGANLKSYKVTDNITKFVTEEKARSLSRSIAKRNDVIVTISGNVGQISYIPIESQYEEYLVSQRQFRVTFDTERVYVPYLVYYFHTREGQHKILSFANQTGVPALAQPLKNFRNIDISLPDIETQRRIANVIESLSDKIEINNRINHNLEAQAQALYKSWFVDFEPFMDGKFVESELGMIPEGWEAKPLSSICHIEKKTINPQKHPTCLFTHYSIPAYDNSELPELQKGSDILSNKYIISDYTILFSKLNPRIKRIWNVYQSESNPICSTEFVVYKPIDIDTYPFLYSFITGDDFYNNIMSKVNGATGSHQRFHPEETLDILVPYHIDCYRLYSQLVLPIIQQIDENKRENHYFASLRDSLLPKLMSGELKINDLTC